MRSKPFIYLFALLALVIGVSAIGALNIIETSVSVSVNPGTTDSSHYFNLQNTGSAALNNILLSVTNFTGPASMAGSIVTFSPAAPSLPAFTSAQPVLLNLAVPAGQKVGMYLATLTARYDGANFDTTSLILTVLPAPDFSITATSPSVTQGSSGTMTITVSNTGNMDMTSLGYSITKPFTGTSGTLTFAESQTGSMNLAYGSSNSLTLTFSPTESVPAGTYTSQITITYGTTIKTLPLTVTVSPIIRDISATVISPRVVMKRGTTNSTYAYYAGALNVTNTGNVALSGVTVVPSALTGTGGTIPASAISVSPSAFLLLTGAKQAMTVTASGVSPSLPDGTYSGEFTVASGSLFSEQVPFSVVISTAAMTVSPDSITYPASGRDENVSVLATITNTGDIDLTGCSMSTTAYSTQIIGSVPSSLSHGSSFTVNLTSYLAEDADTGTVKLGDLNLSCSGFTKLIALNSNVLPMLSIEEVRMSINDESWENTNDGSKFGDELYPGDTFETKITIKNNFDDDDDIEIDDISVSAKFYGMGEDGELIEGEIDEISLNPEDEEDVIIDWESDVVDWEADEGEHVMFIEVTGFDDENAEHTATWTVLFDVKRDSGSDYRITRVEASPSTVKKGDSFWLYVEGKSIGNDDDNVKLKIEAPGLSISEASEFQMGAYDSDDCNAMEETDEDTFCYMFEYKKEYTVLSTAMSGTQQITVQLYRDDGDKKNDEETFDITVTEGSSSSTGTSTSTGTGSTTTSTTTSTATKPKTTTAAKPAADTQSTTQGIDIMYGGATYGGREFVVPGTSIKDMSGQSGVSESMGYIALLSIGALVLVLAIIGLIAYGLSGRRD